MGGPQNPVPEQTMSSVFGPEAVPPLHVAEDQPHQGVEGEDLARMGVAAEHQIDPLPGGGFQVLGLMGEEHGRPRRIDSRQGAIQITKDSPRGTLPAVWSWMPATCSPEGRVRDSLASTGMPAGFHQLEEAADAGVEFVVPAHGEDPFAAP